MKFDQSVLRNHNSIKSYKQLKLQKTNFLQTIIKIQTAYLEKSINQNAANPEKNKQKKMIRVCWSSDEKKEHKDNR